MNAPDCPVCGAALQDRRCPWARLDAKPNAAGLIYCAWPRWRPMKTSITIGFRARTQRP